MERPLLKILLLEDDDLSYAKTASMLANGHRARYQLTRAVGPAEALAFVATIAFDAILVDYQLSEAQGLDFIVQARAAGALGPFIMLTAEDSEELDERALAVGAADFLAKGRTDRRVLERALHYAIDRQRMQQSIRTAAKWQALGELSGCIAHEIINPLFVVESHVSELVREFSGITATDVAPAKHRLEMIGLGIQRMRRVVTALRNFSYNGQERLESTPVAGIVQDAVALCRNRFLSAKVDLQIPDFWQTPSLACRPIDITQALLNLLLNACDAVQGTPKPWVRIEIERIGGEIELAVRDSGDGIPVELRSRIMQGFFTTKEPGKGSGLGLTIAQRAVAAHGGRLGLDETATNTRFVITLPALPDGEVG